MCVVYIYIYTLNTHLMSVGLEPPAPIVDVGFMASIARLASFLSCSAPMPCCLLLQARRCPLSA